MAMPNTSQASLPSQGVWDHVTSGTRVRITASASSTGGSSAATAESPPLGERFAPKVRMCLKMCY